MIRRETIQTEGLTQSILTAGEGPLVVLVHGFPELAISWEAQITALAEAGYRAVAPDMRGYGGTDKPDEVSAYAVMNLVGDMVDLVRALGEQTCFVVGHDWGAPVAWRCALTRPDVFRAVFCLSVPFQPRKPKGPPTAAMAVVTQRLGLGDLYIARFQAPDAHAPFDADPEQALRKMFYAYDGATPDGRQSTGFMPDGVSMMDSIPNDATLPPWLSAEHFQHYVDAFTAGGFAGPMNWYRNLDHDWVTTAWLQDRKIEVPAAFMVGDRDPVRNYAGTAEPGLKDWAPGLRLQTVVPGAGHWIQQEKPEIVNAALLEFLKGLQA